MAAPQNERLQNEMNELENRLRAVWRQYIDCVDRFGTAAGRSLRQEYLALYQRYRRCKRWSETLSTLNQGGTP